MSTEILFIINLLKCDAILAPHQLKQDIITWNFNESFSNSCFSSTGYCKSQTVVYVWHACCFLNHQLLDITRPIFKRLWNIPWHKVCSFVSLLSSEFFICINSPACYKQLRQEIPHYGKYHTDNHFSNARLKRSFQFKFYMHNCIAISTRNFLTC